MYPGGKNSSFRNIINLIPPHEKYIEAFFGSGAVYRNKRPAAISIGIESDYQVINNTIFPLIPDATLTNDYYLKPGPDPRLYILLGQAQTLLKNIPVNRHTFIYADPPYLLETRANRQPIYNHEYCTTEQHSELLTVLKSLPCKVMISGYKSDLYMDMLAGWNIETYNAQTRSGATAIEYLWFNYPTPNQLHDYRYLGENFTDRQRIKRKAARWIKRLKETDITERRAILAALEEEGIIEAYTSA